MSANVLVVYAGGTIGMAPPVDDPRGPLQPRPKDELMRWFPRSLDSLEEMGIVWEIVSPKDENGVAIDPIDSANVSSRHWQAMARTVAERYHDVDGFVILHGTDTMAYTASALSFMLADLDKPVVLTGSQLPLANARTDATTNLVHALLIAGHRASGLPPIPEVVVAFADVILRGNRSRKVSTSAWSAFRSPNHPALGTIGERVVVDTRAIRAAPDPARSPFRLRERLCDDVIEVPLFPGVRAAHIDAQLSLPGVRGVVLRTFGAGNAPTSPEFLEPIRRATDRGVIIVNVTQCVEGTVETGLYESSGALAEAGVVSGFDMTSEAALTKLMSLLGTDAGTARAEIQIDVAGEMTQTPQPGA